MLGFQEKKNYNKYPLLIFAGFAQETEMNNKPCKLTVCLLCVAGRAFKQCSVMQNSATCIVCCAHGMPWQVMTKQHCLLQCCKLSHSGQVGQKYCQKSERFFLSWSVFWNSDKNKNLLKDQSLKMISSMLFRHF